MPTYFATDKGFELIPALNSVGILFFSWDFYKNTLYLSSLKSSLFCGVFTPRITVHQFSPGHRNASHLFKALGKLPEE